MPQKRISPILRSCFESLEHGLFHFLRSPTSTDMKFAILHVDQAIELILKEKVRDLGKSVYKNPKETISIWGAYDVLAENKIKIPEKSDLELLHEERNSIQHKSANPDPNDAAFYIEKAVFFLNRFAKDELGVELKDYISSSHLENFFTKK